MTARTWIGVIAIALITLAIASFVRIQIIENGAVAIFCADHPRDGVCQVRAATIGLFNHLVFGMVALAAAIAGLFRPRSRVLAATAIIASVLGLVLYNVMLSALAVGILVLSLAQAGPERE